MRLALLLFAAASVFASPFHTGASWEWSVVYKGDEAKTITEKRWARIVDSTRDASGPSTRWTFCVSDSATSTDCDTAILAVDTVQPSRHLFGRARWIRGSMFLPLEPRPYTEAETLIIYPRTDSCPTCADAGLSERDSIPWGFGGSTGLLGRWPKLWVDSKNGLLQRWYGPGQWAVPACYKCALRGMDNPQSFTLGSVDWDERLGWKRAVAFDKSWPAHLSSSAYWQLLSKDGQPVPFAELGVAGRWIVPGVGDVRVWEVVDTQGVWNGIGSYNKVRMVTWTILGRSADSSGVARNRIQESILEGADTREDTCELRWLPNADSSWSTCAIKNHEGFFIPWYYRPSAGSWWFGFSDEYNSTLTNENIRLLNRSTSYLRINPLGGIDSSSTQSSTDLSGEHYGSSWKNLETQRMLRANDSIIRQPLSTGIKPAIARHVTGLGDLRELALRYPAASVVVRDAKGSSQTLRLDRFMEQRSAHRLGLRWLEVRLPDGSVRRGSVVD